MLLDDSACPRVYGKSFEFAHGVQKDAVGDLWPDSGKLHDFLSGLKVRQTGNLREEARVPGNAFGCLFDVGVSVSEVALLPQGCQRCICERIGRREGIKTGLGVDLRTERPAEALDGVRYSLDVVVRGNNEGDEGLPGVLAEESDAAEFSYGSKKDRVLRKGTQCFGVEGIEAEIPSQDG